VKSLALSGARAESKALQQGVGVAQALCAQGMPLADALEGSKRLLPHFCIPVIRAGERSGRVVEAFQFLHDHCVRIGPSLAIVRKTWLYPLVCILFGCVIRVGLFLYFGALALAWYLFRDTVVGLGGLVLVAYLVRRVRPVRMAIDRAVLRFPLVRAVEIDLATVLFFRTFSLMYKAGGLDVITMFDLALETVRNTAIQEDLMRIRDVLCDGGTFDEAFRRPCMLSPEDKGMIAAGALGGSLGQSMEKVAELATGRLQTTLDAFNRFSLRLVVFGVGMSIAGTVYLCLLYTVPK
jgi:general secretion pathway protein F